jgi:hypothetical protein
MLSGLWRLLRPLSGLSTNTVARLPGSDRSAGDVRRSDGVRTPTAVIVPVSVWRDIESERETAHLLKSVTMKRRLPEAKERQQGANWGQTERFPVYGREKPENFPSVPGLFRLSPVYCRYRGALDSN